MKRSMFVAVPILVIIAGCGTQITDAQPKTSQPNIKQIFLNYVPPDESTAPHDMEWLCDQYFGDIGYYHSGHIPGKLTIVKNDDSHPYYSNLMNGQSTYIRGGYSVSWICGGQELGFTIFRSPVSTSLSGGGTVTQNTGPYVVAPDADLASNLAKMAYSNSGVHPSTLQDIVLHYVPSNEPGSPHDLEWLMDNSFGDLGYFKSHSIIGSISITSDPKYRNKMTSVMFPEVYNPFKVTWRVKGIDFSFELLQPDNSLVPLNGNAKDLINSAFTN